MKKTGIRLVLPCKKYLKSWITFQEEVLADMPKNHSDYAGYEKHLAASRKPEYFKWLREDRLGVGLKKGRVPQTVWWGIVGTKVVGRISFRHRLNAELKVLGGHIGYAVRPSARGKGYATAILGLVLRKVAKMGYKKVLLTCDADNIASRKTIEANGGRLTKTFSHEGKPECHYWISLK